MKIDFLCTDGSPLGVSCETIWGDEQQIGVGGAELALLTMCEEWHKKGYQVRLYNNPRNPQGSPFEQLPVGAFAPGDNRDVLIVFRSPNKSVVDAKGLKVWWSTDQRTIGDFGLFSALVDKVVCISSHHAEHFADTYKITDTVVIDLPVRLSEYYVDVERIPNRFIFSSVPDRGLANLWRMWPVIRRKIPDASLVITSDYRLWGADSAMNEMYRVKWAAYEGVEFLGAITRQELILEQRKADVHLYPSNYEELFCIAVAESQVAGAYPITSGIGSLDTTNMGKVFFVNADDPRNDRHFVDFTIELLSDRNYLNDMRFIMIMEAQERFSPKRILKEWERKVFK